MYDYPLSPRRTPGALRAKGACAGDRPHRLRYGIGQAKVRHRRANARVVHFQDRDARRTARSGPAYQAGRRRAGPTKPAKAAHDDDNEANGDPAGPPMTISQGPHRGVFRATAKRGFPVPRHRPRHESQTDPQARRAPSEELEGKVRPTPRNTPTGDKIHADTQCAPRAGTRTAAAAGPLRPMEASSTSGHHTPPRRRRGLTHPGNVEASGHAPA